MWCGPKTLPLFWATGTLGHFAPDWYGELSFQPLLPLAEAPSSLSTFPPAALPSVLLPPPHFELKWEWLQESYSWESCGVGGVTGQQLTSDLNQ